MPPITALLHTKNDARRVGRALETLRVCDEIVVVDHGSQDGTLRVARDYGAHIVIVETVAPPAFYLKGARSPWIFCLEARESVSEGLEATLLEWRSAPAVTGPAFSVALRQETSEGWADLSGPETRLVPRNWEHFADWLPAHNSSALPLEGEILRFAFP